MSKDPRGTDIRKSLMRASSVEMTPAYITRTPGAFENLAPNTRVFVTWLPGTPFDATLNACISLRQRGYVPVAHVAARSLHDTAHFRAICNQLVSRAQADSILLIAGGQPESDGMFSNTLDVLRTGIASSEGLRKIYVAGHPEGHPQASAQTLRDTLHEKQMLATQQGLDMELVTQFGFDPAAMLDWEEMLRKDGITLPVNLGLYGLASPQTLLRYGLACGVGQSLRLLKTRRTRLHRWFFPCNPQSLVDAVARRIAETPDTLFRGLHFFPFGAVPKTLAWRHKLSD